MQFEVTNVSLRAGDRLKIKGEILPNADRFHIDLGSRADDLALHFNPRFHDETDGAVLVCNSMSSGSWGVEKREIYNPLEQGTNVKIVVKLEGDTFELELPDGCTVNFPNRVGMDVINYIRVGGDFKMTSFKIC